MAKAPNALWRREDFGDLSDSGTLDRFLRLLNSFAADVKGALSRGLTLGENSLAFWKTLDVTCPDWIAPSAFGWSWANYPGYAPFGYLRDGPEVRLRLTMAGGTIGQPITTLPVGFRPPNNIICPAYTNTGAGRLDVNADGTLVPVAGGNTYFSAGVVGFLSADAAPARLSVKFKNDLGASKPKGIVVAQAQDVTVAQTATPVALGSVSWTTSGDQIVLTDIAGMAPGRKYRLSLVVLGG